MECLRKNRKNYSSVPKAALKVQPVLNYIIEILAIVWFIEKESFLKKYHKLFVNHKNVQSALKKFGIEK